MSSKQKEQSKNQMITNYFSKSKANNKPSATEIEKSAPIKCSDAFYENALKEQRSKSVCEKQKCIDLKSELEVKLKELEKKCRQHEDAINMCSSIIAEKDHEIIALRQMIGESPSAPIQPVTDTKSSFANFENDFNLEQLASLRAIGPTIRDDSSFISLAIKSLYTDKLSFLQSKSLTGRTKNEAQKSAITPAKVNILQGLFTERIEGLVQDFQENNKRKKRLNKLIRDALYNIVQSIS